MKKILCSVVFLATLFLITVGQASAHVVVKPNSVGIGSFQTFTMGVPVEKAVPTVGMRLVIPEALEFVTPNVKSGWTISIKKSGEGEAAKVTEIEWKGGSIPQGQRDDFLFSAKVPATEVELHWKAYQTYKDGTVVAWDAEQHAEDSDDENQKSGPYSVTKVVDDLSIKPETPRVYYSTSPKVKVAIAVSLVLSACSIALTLKRKV